jgi:Fuc2NAc and GlcNAc transferase
MNWIAALLAGGVTWLLVPGVRRYALANGLIDRPGPRRSHHRLVARGGGMAVALGILTALIWLAATVARAVDPTPWIMNIGTAAPLTAVLGLLTGLVVVAGLGAWDDHRPLPVRIRLPMQLLVAVGLVVLFGGVPAISAGEHTLAVPWLWSLLAVPAVVWMMNLFNFMDGSDGLAALQAGTSAVLMAWAFDGAGAAVPAALAVVIASAAWAFLLWNRPPARIFLGDSGSLSLGFLLGGLALIGSATGQLSVWAAFLAVSVFVVDATATLAWRLVRGGEWYTPHREHAYQLLIRAGWSHGRVLGALGALNALVVAPAFVLAVLRPAWDVWIAVGAGVILLGIWTLIRFRASAEKRDE